MASGRRNVIVFICHDLGRHLGCYGVPGVRTPRIDGFAASAVRFENSFCTAPQCSPSRAALWTGRYPHANGVVGLTHGPFANDLNPGERHLAQTLNEHGFETHLFGGQHEARSPERCGYRHVHKGRYCDDLAADFSGFMAGRRDTDAPLFAQIGTFEPHRPFPHRDIATLDPADIHVPGYLPDIPEVREDLVELEASVACVDRAFGRVLDALGTSAIAGDTLIVLTADHGIGFPRAKMTLYDPGLEVPLILAGPGLASGEVRGELISNVDVLPTLLELLSLPPPSNLHGRSFKNLLTDGEYVPNEAIFAEKTYHGYYDPMRAIRTQRWKAIANFEATPGQETPPDHDNNAKGYVEVGRALGTPHWHLPFELYDLANDPFEQRNLADEPAHSDTRDRLLRRLRRWMEETGDPLLEGPMSQAAYRERMKTFKQI